MKRLSMISGVALGCALTGAAASAHAVDCTSLDNPVFISGSTAVVALVQQLGPILAGADNKISIVYQAGGSCSGVSALAMDTKLMGTGQYWNSDTSAKTPETCDMPTDGQPIDLILSDVFKESCDGVDVAKMNDASLLIIPFGFIVPSASSATAIDAREGYYAYGKGPSAMITPWNEQSVLFQRDSGSGTQITTFKALHLKSATANGVAEAGTGKMVTDVAAAQPADKAIGFGSLDVVDQHRDTVRALAYRHWGQQQFYWPDSTNASYDKKNVRDGHYPIWGYEHAIVRTDRSHDMADEVVKYISGDNPLPGDKTIAEVTTNVGLVPLCAMEVTRETDGGDFSVAHQSSPCTCFFEANVPNGSTSCDECASGKDSDCASGEKCVNKYCEKMGSN